MLRAFFSSATGMKAQETLLDVTANNLANVNTNGFKRSHVDFADLLYSSVRKAGAETSQGQNAPVGLQIGSGARATGTTKLFTPGTLQQTGNPTDFAIEGDGFFKVQNAGGDVRYTRDGAFRADNTGQLVTVNGYILDPAITVPDGATDVSVGNDGTVSAMVAGVQANLGQIQLARFLNPAGLSDEGNNLYAVTAASGAEVLGTPGQNGIGTIMGGYLEKSNVEVVTELVSLITAQRAYEVNSRAIRAGDEMLSNTNQIVR
ncbi:MAG: flagellar basal-body rod protein FlgG [Planctomycetales bacterium]|nr:flagellar basal-body rod protein FlgG [Planctomycetales bacterium]